MNASRPRPGSGRATGTAYLSGLGLGPLIGSVKAPHLQRPALAFLGLQAAVGIVATGVLTAFLAIAARIGSLSAYFARYEPLDVPSAVGTAPFLLLYVVVPAVLVLPATLLMGASFPVLQRVVHTDLGHVGSRVGILLLDWLGTSGTLKLLAAVAGAFAVTALRMVPRAQAPAYARNLAARGAIPALLHPDPRDAAVIGLGSGDTVSAVAGRPGLERIACIEIVRPQLETLRELAGTYPYGGLRGLLGDRRIEHIFGDGRIHLMRTSRRYDIIEADALRPGSAYSGNMYSEEYFDLVRSRLRPNGLAATWAPTVRIHNAFLRVFPHVISLPGMMVGSNEPIVIDRDALAARLADPAVVQHYESAQIDIKGLMDTYLKTPTTFGPDFDRASLTEYNTDLFPRDEYNLSR